MTDTIKNANENKTGRKPDWKLVQEKAYHKIKNNGQLFRKSATIDISVGWNETSKDGMNYISWSDSVIPVTPDIDGCIKLVTFPVQNDT